MYTPMYLKVFWFTTFFAINQQGSSPKLFINYFYGDHDTVQKGPTWSSFSFPSWGSETWSEKTVSNNLPALGESLRRKSPQDPGRNRAWVNPSKDNL